MSFRTLLIVAVLVITGTLVYNAVNSAPEAPAGAQLPAHFEVKQNATILVHSFDVVANGQKYGSVSRQVLAWGTTFDYTDNSGQSVAQGRKAVLSWGTHIDVMDPSGRKIGAIQERVFSSLLGAVTEYSILDGNDRLIARSEKVQILSTDITLYAGSGAEMASLHRPAINIVTDTWTVDVARPGAVDQRLLVMIAAYKTFSDDKK